VGAARRGALLFPIVNQESAGEKLFVKFNATVGKLNTLKWQGNNKNAVQI
jgi:hypothetical protein